MQRARRIELWLRAIGAVIASLIFVARAPAEIVYAHAGSSLAPGGIWIMKDDGSGKRELIPERLTGEGENLTEPSVDPSGRIVLFTGHGAIWKWQAGRVVNLTSELRTVIGGSNSGWAYADNAQAEAVGDGTFVWQHTVGISGVWSEMHTTIMHAQLDGKRVLPDIPRTCGDVWRDASPAPRPGGGIAYVGCDRRTGLSLQDHTYDQITMYTPNEQMVLAEAEDLSWESPSWDPTGRWIVAVVTAPVSLTGPAYESLWVIDSTAPDTTRYRRVMTWLDGWFTSPRFMRSGRIVFGFRPRATGRSNIYSVPLSCDSCDLASARQLTTDGVSDEPAWTASSLQVDGARIQAGQRLRSALSRGLRVTVVCAGGCLAGAPATINGRLARSLKLISRTARLKPYQVGSGTLRAGSGSRTLTVRFNSRARRALARVRSVRLAIQVRCVSTSGHGIRTYRLALTLRR